jgi:fluoride exporter
VEARDLLLVAAGGALGALARFGVSTWLPRVDFPWHTLLVNILGSFVLGFLFLEQGMEHPTRLFVAVGFIGAFTTMSTYSVETVELWREGTRDLAAANLILNGVGGPLAALAGWRIALA